MRKRIKVTYRKLGKDKVWGWAHVGENMVEIDERLRGKKLLEILIHESLHIIQPHLSETKTEETSIALTNLLWKEGWRRTDNENSQPLQDGKK